MKTLRSSCYFALVPLLFLMPSLRCGAGEAKDQTTLPSTDKHALKAATHDLCHKQVALLGESPTHGDGHTEAFKAQLVQSLIRHCGFDAVAFEASSYEFIAMDRAVRNGTATADMLSNAVGGLWKFDREFQPLVPFLLEQAKWGRVKLAGLDDQIGGLAQDFTNAGMFIELTQPLGAQQAAACKAGFQHYAKSDYPQDAPYSRKEHDELLGCIHAMRAAIDGGDLAVRTTEQREMLTNLERLIEPDLGTIRERYAARERALYENFEVFTKRLPRSAKVIVWGASVHLGNRPGAVSKSAPDESMGSRVKARLGAKAFGLGFAAARGSYRTFKTKHMVELPPSGSLEAKILANHDTSAVYVNARKLKQMGEVPSYALEHKIMRADWSTIFDGVVVFCEEWPSHNTRAGYE